MDHAVGDRCTELKPGDVGGVCHVQSDAKAIVVEFTSLDGETEAIATVLPSQTRAVSKADITHARTISSPVA